jgi:hypothetical protein
LSRLRQKFQPLSGRRVIEGDGEERRPLVVQALDTASAVFRRAVASADVSTAGR